MSQATKISQAIELAAKAHSGQYRKGSSVPYVWHPLSVGKLLEDTGCSSQTIVAGILHDLVEDTSVTIGEITQRFGGEVAEIVQSCSVTDRSMPWEERKKTVIDNLKTARFEVKIVVAADKIDNLRATAADLAKLGDKVWKRFNRGREKQEWYYRNVLVSLREGAGQATDHPLIRTLELEIERVFGMQSPAIAYWGTESGGMPDAAGEKDE